MPPPRPPPSPGWYGRLPVLSAGWRPPTLRVSLEAGGWRGPGRSSFGQREVSDSGWLVDLEAALGQLLQDARDVGPEVHRGDAFMPLPISARGVRCPCQRTSTSCTDSSGLIVGSAHRRRPILRPARRAMLSASMTWRSRKTSFCSAGPCLTVGEFAGCMTRPVPRPHLHRSLVAHVLQPYHGAD